LQARKLSRTVRFFLQGGFQFLPGAKKVVIGGGNGILKAKEAG